MNEQQLNALFTAVKLVAEGNGSLTIHVSQYDKDFNPHTKEEAEMHVRKLAEVIGAEVDHDTTDNEGSPGVYDFSMHKDGISFIHSYVSDERIQRNKRLEGIV